ncbi:hypothetical protein [Ekhidna sp.]
MKWLTKLFSGDDGIVKGISYVAERFLGSKEQKHEFKMEVERFLYSKEVEARNYALDVEKEFNQKIKDLEGTAADLKSFGWIGKIIVLLRGAFRPLVSYSMAIVDFYVFSGKWELPNDEQVVSAFWIINLVIFVFYFGERSIKNITPLIGMYFGKQIKNNNE